MVNYWLVLACSVILRISINFAPLFVGVDEQFGQQVILALSDFNSTAEVEKYESQKTGQHTPLQSDPESESNPISDSSQPNQNSSDQFSEPKLVPRKVIVKKQALDCKRKLFKTAYLFSPEHVWYQYDMKANATTLDECRTFDKPPFYAYTHKFIAHLIVQNFGEAILSKPINQAKTDDLFELDFEVAVVASILICDLFFYQSAIFMFRKELGMGIILAMNVPALILTDYAYYNFQSVPMGLVVWAIWLMINKWHMMATIMLTLAACFDQTTILIQAPFLVYFIAHVVQNIDNAKLDCIKVFSAIILTGRGFFFEPYFLDVVPRMFPYEKGIFIDNNQLIGSVWSLLDLGVYQFSTELTGVQQYQLATAASLLVAAPSLVLLWIKPTKEQFLRSLLANAISFYLLGPQIQSFNIVLPMVILVLVQEDWGTNLVGLQSLSLASESIQTYSRHSLSMTLLLGLSMLILQLQKPDSKDNQRNLMVKLAQGLLSLIIGWHIIKVGSDVFYTGANLYIEEGQEEGRGILEIINVLICFLLLCACQYRTQKQMRTSLVPKIEKIWTSGIEH